MAFAKAKLLRFNDISSCAPPPGAYNPKYEEHVPGVKYVEPQQSPVSSISDNVSSNVSVSNFRTPIVPRRKMSFSNSAGRKPKIEPKTCTSPLKSEALREKIVECINKDETIKDLESQLEELKLALSNLNVQINHLKLERDELTTRLQEVQNQLDTVNKQLVQKDVDNKAIADDFNKEKAELKAQNVAEMKQLDENLKLLQETLKISIGEHEAVLKETQLQLEQTQARCDNLQKMYNELQKLYNELKEKYEESLQIQNKLKTSHSDEIDSLNTLHEQELESQTRTIVEYWKETIKQIERDNQDKIKEIQEAQKLELDKFKNEIISEKTQLEDNICNLKLDMEKLNSELEETKNKLKTETNEHQKDKATALAEKHCYEVTLNKTNETVNALKNRLIHSDKDVEQLTKELNTLEKSKLDMEEKYMQENDHLKKINEELESKSLIVLQDTVVCLENELLNKIDTFKSKADSEIIRLTAIIENQTKELKKLHSYIQQQQNVHSNAFTLVSDARNEIDKLESEAQDYKNKISQMENDLEKKQHTIEANEKQVKELKDKLKERDTEMNELASVYKKYIQKSRQYDELQQKYEWLGDKCQRLEKTVEEQNSLIGPFREQLENYEQECQILLVHKGAAEKEAREMGLKYAEILGNQNLKQKIKHMVNLKKRNIELMECKQKYECKIRQQNRIIEKLKNKLTQKSKTRELDKENIGSPRLPNVYSPAALKERN